MDILINSLCNFHFSTQFFCSVYMRKPIPAYRKTIDYVVLDTSYMDTWMIIRTVQKRKKFSTYNCRKGKKDCLK